MIEMTYRDFFACLFLAFFAGMLICLFIALLSNEGGNHREVGEWEEVK